MSNILDTIIVLIIIYTACLSWLKPSMYILYLLMQACTDIQFIDIDKI